MAEIGLNDIFHKLGGLESSLAGMNKRLDHADEKRAEGYRSMEEMRGDIHDVKGRVSSLDDRVSKMEPSLADYHDKVQQVKGAGKLGRALWWIGGAVILPLAGYAAHAWGVLGLFFGKTPPH